jgi:uncharacterized protein (TIGR02996 family)
MSDRDAFLRAIREHPDDDTVRLVFADWLDDRGDPLGGFIRLQIELEPIRDQLDNPHVQDLTEREAVLLGTHGHDWLGPAVDLVGEYPAFGPVFRRGLPEMVCLSLDTFLRRGGELFAACPTVREVCLYGVSGRGADLAACPHLGHVETLEIADWVFLDEGLHDALTKPGLRNVRCWWWESDQGYWVNELARSPNWPQSVEVIQLNRDIAEYAGYECEGMNAIRQGQFARLIQPYAARFPLAADVEHGFCPGINDEGDPVLLAVRSDGAGMWVLFDVDGKQQDASTFGHITAAEIESWRAEFGSLIRVAAFDIGGLSLRLWPAQYIRDYFHAAQGRPPGVTDHWWASRGGVLKRWLHEGRFVIEWDGREYTADATGKIVAR